MIGSPDKEVRVLVFFCCEWAEHLSFWATFRVCECRRLCIVLGSTGPGEMIPWTDAALQEIRVSGQRGSIPEELCLSGRSVLWTVLCHCFGRCLSATQGDQLWSSGWSGDLRVGETPQWIFLHNQTICRHISELRIGELEYQFPPKKEGTALTCSLFLFQSVTSLMQRSSFQYLWRRSETQDFVYLIVVGSRGNLEKLRL